MALGAAASALPSTPRARRASASYPHALPRSSLSQPRPGNRRGYRLEINPHTQRSASAWAFHRDFTQLAVALSRLGSPGRGSSSTAALPLCLPAVDCACDSSALPWCLTAPRGSAQAHSPRPWRCPARTARSLRQQSPSRAQPHETQQIGPSHIRSPHKTQQLMLSCK